MNFVTPCISV